MLDAILTCACSGQDQKAITAFQILFPGKPVPEIRHKNQMVQLAEKYPDTNLDRYLRGVAKTNGKWMYYIVYTEDGDITELYNLTNGQRVA